MNKEIIEVLEDLKNSAEQIHKNKSFDDLGQIINKSGEMEVLEIIGLINDKIEELKD